MSDTAFHDYLARWRGATPQREVAWLFLRPDERICFGALAAMEVEWLKSLREVSEPQVATMKLGWWREEMQRAKGGRASHPLTQPLFADARARAVPLGYWLKPVEAAIGMIDAAPAADFAAQCAAAAPLADAVAELETKLWYGPERTSPAAARVTLGAHLLAGLRALETEVGHGRSPIPMNLLARHGLTIGGLGEAGDARRVALHDELAELRQVLDAAAGQDGPLTLFRNVALHQDRITLARAAAAADPLPVLRATTHGLAGLLRTWRAARAWRRAARGRAGVGAG